MKYKLVVLDMDGTLLNSNHKISETNKEILQRLASKGVEVVLASGRPFEAAYLYSKELGIDSPIIASNGAMVKSPRTEELYYSATVTKDLAEEIVEYGRQNDYPTSLYVSNEVYTYDERMEKLHIEVEGIHPTIINSFESDKPIYKVIYMDTPERIEEAYIHLEAAYRGKLYITRSADILLDVMSKEVSKGIALEKLRESLGIPKEEVIVFGNSYNDVSMFEEAGLAVAMENSPQAVKDAAHVVTKTNDEDGVAHILKEVFEIE